MSTLARRAVRLVAVGVAAFGLLLGASLAVDAAPVVGTTYASSPSSTDDAWSSPWAGAGNSSANLGEARITSATAPSLARAWTRPAPYAGFYSVTIVDGIVYTTQASGNAMVPWHLVAFDARTGSRLWQLVLPLGSYYRGVSVSGSTAVLPYDGYTYPGGVVAVDLSKHRLLWARDLGQDPNGQPYTAVQPATVDSGRVVMAGGAGLSAYDLVTGKPLWTHVFSYPQTLGGYAATKGVVYVGGDGVLALDGATGRVLWQGMDGTGQPVVADGHVIVASTDAVASFPVDGCGAVTCAPEWRTLLGPHTYRGPVIGGAGDGTVFASYVDQSRSPWRSGLLRLDTETGAIQWSTPLAGIGGLVLGRAGDLVWATTQSQPSGHTRLTAYTATGQRTVPVTSLREPGGGGYPQGFAIADGSLVLSELSDGLFAFRVPGAS